MTKLAGSNEMFLWRIIDSRPRRGPGARSELGQRSSCAADPPDSIVSTRFGQELMYRHAHGFQKGEVKIRRDGAE